MCATPDELGPCQLGRLFKKGNEWARAHIKSGGRSSVSPEGLASMQQQSQRCRIAEVSLAFNELDQRPRRRRMALRLGRLFQTHLHEQRWRGERIVSQIAGMLLKPTSERYFFDALAQAGRLPGQCRAREASTAPEQ